MEKIFTVEAPLGITMIPKEEMTETELREFIPTLNQDPTNSGVWEAKAKQDSIGDLIELLTVAGFKITQK